MGSYSASTSNATDNRQAITDQALGVSSSGNGNNVALSGHIINMGSTSGANSNTAARSISYSRPLGFWGGGIPTQTVTQPEPAAPVGNNTVNILDQGAVDKALDFAAFSLSETLGSIISGNKQTATQLANAQQYSMETIGNAINSAATTTSQAAQQAATENSTTLKRVALIAAAAAGAWYLLFKGKK